MYKYNLFDIKYSNKFPYVKVSKNNFFAIFFIAMLFGVFAFFGETLIDYFTMGYLFDRGFLIGPFVPIYFFVILIGLCYLKTPPKTVKAFFIQAIIIGAGISAVEFVVGNICEMLFHTVLWVYDDFMPLSYKYVSLSVAAIWGLFGSFFVMFIAPKMKSLADKIPHKAHIPFYLIFTTLLLVDFGFTLYITSNNNWVYQELYRFKASLPLTILLLFSLIYVIGVCYLCKKIVFLIKKHKFSFTLSFLLLAIIPLIYLYMTCPSLVN